MKKLILWTLMLAMVLGMVPAVYAQDGSVVQAGNEKGELLQAQVNFGGYIHSATVMRAEDGTILAPLHWMTYYGGLESREYKGGLEYYKPGQKELRNYAKRWSILPQTGDYMVSWYFDTRMFAAFVRNASDCSLADAMKLMSLMPEPQIEEVLDRYFSQKNTKVQRAGDNYMPIHRGKFSKMLPYGDDYWVPLSELLALLELDAGVDKNGRILCMKPSQITLFDVLYDHAEDIEDLLFDSDDVVGNDVMAGTGWFVATCSGELYNLVPSLGREIDYKEIFTSYLQDNEVYLSTFNSETDSKTRYYKEVAETFKGVKTIFEISAKGHKPIYDMFLESVTDPEFYESFFEPAKKAGKAIDIAANILPYISAFANQVEDHRLMMDAVYGHSASKKWPSYVASQAVEKTYESTSHLAVSGTVDLTRKLVMEELSEKIYKKAFKGWYYAVEVTKVLCKEDYEYVVNSSKINLVSNTVQYAYDIFEQRVFERQFKKTGMNNIRLCLMMSLVGSRHAYKTYWKGDAMKEEIDDIDEILSKLYTAGTNRQENTSQICKDRLERYQMQIPGLRLTKNDPLVIVELDMLQHAIGNGNWKNSGWTVKDPDGDMREEVSILADTPSGVLEVSIDFDQDKVTATTGTALDVMAYLGVEIIPDEHMVFGDVAGHLAALDAHFAKRAGVIGTLNCDVNGDGMEDRIYAVRDAAAYWDRDASKPLGMPTGNLSLVVAEAREEGVMLRYYFDPDFKGGQQTEFAFADGELLVDGYAYSYLEELGTPFKRVGLVRLQSIYSYLTGEVKPWEQARVELRYPDDSDRNKMYVDVDGVEFYIHGGKKGNKAIFYEIAVEAREKAVPVIGNITTDHSAKQIIEALTLASWDSHEIVPRADNLSAVMGPYPLMGGEEEAYECSVLWAMPDGEIYQLTMKLHGEGLDATPYSLNITSLNKPKAAVHELLLRSPEQVEALLSGYSQRAYPEDGVIYGEGYIGDAYVEVRFAEFDGAYRAEDVDVLFHEDVVTVFPGLDSSASAEEAKDFLQPEMDWDLQDSKSDGDRDLYYSTNFHYDEDAEVFWYATMITGYTWTSEDGYSEGMFAGIGLSYSGEKDDSSMSWYWVLYG